MRIILRMSIIVAMTLTIIVGCLTATHPASASAVKTTNMHTITHSMVPLANGPFTVEVEGAKVTGPLNFTGQQTFQLLDVVLYDTKCDASSAYFQASDQNSEYKVHQNGGGCGSKLKFGPLNGSASYHIQYLFISVWTNSDFASTKYYNPY